MKELTENLEDIYKELVSGKIPNVRKTAVLKLKRKSGAKKKIQ